MFEDKLLRSSSLTGKNLVGVKPWAKAEVLVARCAGHDSNRDGIGFVSAGRDLRKNITKDYTFCSINQKSLKIIYIFMVLTAARGS